MLNTAEAPLAFSRAARFGRGAMTLGAMPCPSRWRGGDGVGGGVSEIEDKKAKIDRQTERQGEKCVE